MSMAKLARKKIAENLMNQLHFLFIYILELQQKDSASQINGSWSSHGLLSSPAYHFTHKEEQHLLNLAYVKPAASKTPSLSPPSF